MDIKVTAEDSVIKKAMTRMNVRGAISWARKKGVRVRYKPNDKCPCKSGRKFKKCCGR